MKPDVPAVLSDLVARIAGEIAPHVQPAYLAGSLGMAAALIAMATEEWDNAAQWRVEENTALRAIFNEAGGLGLTADLGQRLARLAASRDADVRVSTLDAANAQLRGALIELHAAVERLDGVEARRIEGTIWAELAASTERRRRVSGNF